MNTTRRQSVKAAQVKGLHNASSDNLDSDKDTARKEEDEETAVKEEMKKQLRSKTAEAYGKGLCLDEYKIFLFLKIMIYEEERVYRVLT